MVWPLALVGSVLGGVISGTIRAGATVASGALQGAGSALGGALQGALTEPDTVINSYGAAGQSAKPKRSGGGSTVSPTNATSPQQVKPDNQMPMEELLTIAIGHLSSISSNLEEQSKLHAHQIKQEQIAERESMIEGISTMMLMEREDAERIRKSKGRKKNKDNPLVSMLKKGLLVGTIAGIIGLEKIMDQYNPFEAMSTEWEKLKDEYSWLKEISSYPDKLVGWWKANSASVMSGQESLRRSPIPIVGSIANAYYEGWDALAGTGMVLDRPKFNLQRDYGMLFDGDKISLRGHKGRYTKDTLPPGYQEIYNAYHGIGDMTYEQADAKYRHLRVDGFGDAVGASDATKATATATKSDSISADKPSVAATSNKNKTNEEIAMEFFMGKGYNRNQAAGIVGNLAVESRLDPAAVGDNKKAYGIAQWHAPRQKDFQNRYGKDIRNSDLLEQLDFVHWELNNTHKSAGDALRNTNTAYGAAVVVEEKYEIPGIPHRDRRTANAARLAGGSYEGSPSSHGSATGDNEILSTDWAGGDVEGEETNFKKVVRNFSRAFKAMAHTDTVYKELAKNIPNKSKFLTEDQAKREADAALGKNVSKAFNDIILSQDQKNYMRDNNNSLDVIDPNYKMGDNIINSYILSFSNSKRWYEQ